jgi:hypothetical protein
MSIPWCSCANHRVCVCVRVEAIFKRARLGAFDSLLSLHFSFPLSLTACLYAMRCIGEHMRTHTCTQPLINTYTHAHTHVTCTHTHTHTRTHTHTHTHCIHDAKTQRQWCYTGRRTSAARQSRQKAQHMRLRVACRRQSEILHHLWNRRCVREMNYSMSRAVATLVPQELRCWKTGV